MSDELHQLVHGYEHGHGLLAGSVSLSRQEQDLVARLSDLSGGMVPGEVLVPYVTVYPLPSRAYYAVAKTWPDLEAARAGCVLTHTVLVPMDLWMSAAEITVFASLLRFPQRNTRLESLHLREGFNIESVHDLGLDDFIAKFFGEGIRPLVWFGVQYPEAITWRLLSALWPALRAEFSCCTLTLQPRTLDERPFDLMFAPLSARSRFAEYLGTHEISASREVKVEPWAVEWRAQLLGGTRNSEASMADLSAGLDASPNAIRKVFLFSDLRERAKTAPLGAIGALDVLESLGTGGNQVRLRISDLVRRAVEGTANAPPSWALEVLCLVGLRLDRIDAALIEPEIDDLIARRVREHVERAPIEALALAERFSTRDLGKLPRSFIRGLSDALAKNVDQSTLAALASATHVGLNILEIFPETVAILLSAGRRFGMPLGDIIASWYGETRDPVRRQALRSALVPELEQANEAPLLMELLRDLGAVEVDSILSRVESRVVAPELGRLYSELIGERFTSEVIAWAANRRVGGRTAAAYVTAGAIPLTTGGIQEAAAFEDSGFVVAAVIDRALRKAPPAWVRSAAMQPALWQCLLNSVDDDVVAAVLVRLVGALDHSVIGRVPAAEMALERAPRAVQVHAVREVLLDHVLGAATSADLRRWMVTHWAGSVLSSDASLLRSVIANEVSLGFERLTDVWSGSWRTLEIVSASVPDISGSIFEICGLLLWRRPIPWPLEVTEIWRRLLNAAPRASFRHEAACAQALRFCFDNTRLPLGPVVAEAFFTVHAAALRDQARPSWDVFGWTSWDKGGELRRRLVDAFQHGWEPRWFVIAADEPWLLRKLCKRMLRQWRGHAFLQKAFEQLRERPPTQLTQELADILRDPDYVVDWD